MTNHYRTLSPVIANRHRAIAPSSPVMTNRHRTLSPSSPVMTNRHRSLSCSSPLMANPLAVHHHTALSSRLLGSRQDIFRA
jgi:hypothetical protein